MILDTVISLAVIALAVKLVIDGRRHLQQIRTQAALDRILAPEPLSAKYVCLMSADEIHEMSTGRWQD
jgi:hypothetical protein